MDTSREKYNDIRSSKRQKRKDNGRPHISGYFERRAKECGGTDQERTATHTESSVHDNEKEASPDQGTLLEGDMIQIPQTTTRLQATIPREDGLLEMFNKKSVSVQTIGEDLKISQDSHSPGQNLSVSNRNIKPEVYKTPFMPNPITDPSMTEQCTNLNHPDAAAEHELKDLDSLIRACTVLLPHKPVCVFPHLAKSAQYVDLSNDTSQIVDNTQTPSAGEQFGESWMYPFEKHGRSRYVNASPSKGRSIYNYERGFNEELHSQSTLFQRTCDMSLRPERIIPVGRENKEIHWRLTIPKLNGGWRSAPKCLALIQSSNSRLHDLIDQSYKNLSNANMKHNDKHIETLQHITQMVNPQRWTNVDSLSANITEMGTTYTDEIEILDLDNDLNDTSSVFEPKDEEYKVEDLIEQSVATENGDLRDWIIVPPDEKEWWKLRIRRI